MKTKLKINGMSCNHCVSRVEETVKALPGVKKVNVHLKKEIGTVTLDETVIQPLTICQAINDLGYQAEVI
ncbi:copper chaperone CopZ [Candidatus Enterococcus mangumiae]|uniref:Copper chaperone CopZ n=1 Tax=Candidatus Enterococcus mangumiae TaxID=2230878 RepID=A0ABZ2SRX5_9ENTE|nr:copper chaperone CopZ [Enterococcus sp. DIV1094]MBO0489974.1 copper chaperone CopZ [Enterococcus sp. DIV1094]